MTSPMLAIREEAIGRTRCPSCGAAPGKQCSALGLALPASKTHDRRMARAWSFILDRNQPYTSPDEKELSMDPGTGALIEADDKTIKEFEKAVGREFVPVTGEKELEAVRAMTLHERQAYAKKVQRRRAQVKAARKMRRKQRK